MAEKHPDPLSLVDNMIGDATTALAYNRELVIAGPALKALLSVLQVAKKATELRLVMTVPENGRRTVCIDFDGVLHSYTSGWKGPTEIADPPTPGAFDWLRKMLYYKEGGKADRTFNVAVYSSRSKVPGAIEAMQQWFRHHGLEEKDLVLMFFPDQKPASVFTIDDRAMCFEGTFPEPGEIISFKPWNKRS